MCQTSYIYSIFNEYLLSSTMFCSYIFMAGGAVGIGQSLFSHDLIFPDGDREWLGWRVISIHVKVEQARYF